jgi:hypothetical protein
MIVIIIGFVFFAAAVAAASILIAQNYDAMINVHGLGYTWNVHVYWLVVAGLVITAVGLLGLALMRRGSARYRQLRREHRGLVRDHERLASSYPAPGDATAVTQVTDRRQPVASTAGPASAPPASEPDGASAGPGTSGRLSRVIHPRRGSHSQPAQR